MLSLTRAGRRRSRSVYQRRRRRRQAAEQQAQTRRYVGRGAIAKLWQSWNWREVLIEGPAGTGKTRGVLEWFCWLAITYPGIRVLLARKTRKSMTDSVLVTLEEEVLGMEHPVVKNGPTRGHRQHYLFPNASQLILCGLDNPMKIMSAQYDAMGFFEATEMSEEDLEMGLTRLRNHRIAHPLGPFPSGHLPDGQGLREAVEMGRIEPLTFDRPLFFEQAVIDVNPAHEGHWLNRRADSLVPNPRSIYAGGLLADGRSVVDAYRQGAFGGANLGPDGQAVVLNRMARLLSRHRDNPTVTREYLQELSNLTGYRRDRLYLGKWVSAEGLIWPGWNASHHMVRKDELPELVAYFASFDWGYRDAACFQVWGVDSTGAIYRVAEVYRKGWQLDRWATVVEELNDEFKLRSIVCSHERPDIIDMFNDRLGTPGGRDMARIARKADTSWETGRDMVEWALSDDEHGRPRLFLMRDATRYGVDPECESKSLPTSTEDEIPDYKWAEHKDGQPDKEAPDPLCEDHGCDAMRYAVMWHWRRDLRPRKKKVYAPGSIGALLKHDEIERAEGWKRRRGIR